MGACPINPKASFVDVIVVDHFCPWRLVVRSFHHNFDKREILKSFSLHIPSPPVPLGE